MFKRKRHNIPTLNTSSTADISFILLIFFLVTTSMNQSKGIERQLPPENKDKTVTVTDVSKKNILVLKLKSDGSILADDEPIKIGELRKHVIHFIENKAERDKHIISVDAERDARYNDYFNIQNEIIAAYRTLRNMRALAVYRHPLEECTPEERMELREFYPQRVADVYSDSEEGGDK